MPRPLALSPDGSALAIVDTVTRTARSGSSAADELRGRPDPGHGAAASIPTFSPDGQWIAFLAGTALKKVRPGEGGAVTLADSADRTQGGVAWLDDGTLVYPGPGLEGRPLLRVSAGAAPSTVVAGRTRRWRDWGLACPTALPGARGVLFTACTSACVSDESSCARPPDRSPARFRSTTRWRAGTSPPGTCSTCGGMGRRWSRRSISTSWRITGPAVPVLEGVIGQRRTPPTWPSRGRLRWSTCRDLPPSTRASWCE